MVYRGRIKNGAIVLDEPLTAAEGTEVRVMVVGESQLPRPLTVSPELAKLCGKATDLPPDAARNIDHYLYGAPKK